MPAGPFEVYQIANNKIHKGEIDLDDDTLGAMLLTSAYTPNLVTDAFVNTIAVHEAAGGGGYTREVVSNSVVELETGESVHRFDNLDFGDNVTITAKYLTIFRNTGNDVTSEVIYVCDLNIGQGDLSSSNGNFDIGISPSGVHKITPNV